jgi:predicted enzyme related to lactoylglutathione lyase
MAEIRYIVDDVAAAVAFYTQSLGFTLEQQFGPAMAIVRRGDLALWLAGPASSAAKPMPDGRRPVPAGWARIVLTVDNLDAVRAQLEAAGVVSLNEIVSGPGGRQMLYADPSGNPIELFEPRR